MQNMVTFVRKKHKFFLLICTDKYFFISGKIFCHKIIFSLL